MLGSFTFGQHDEAVFPMAGSIGAHGVVLRNTMDKKHGLDLFFWMIPVVFLGNSWRNLIACGIT